MEYKFTKLIPLFAKFALRSDENRRKSTANINVTTFNIFVLFIRIKLFESICRIVTSSQGKV